MPVHGHCPVCKTSLEFPRKAPADPMQCPVCTSRIKISGSDAKQLPFIDFYTVLGVDPHASIDEISKAARSLVMELHPDRNPDNPNAASRLRDVIEAKNFLTDPNKKREYDSLFHADVLKKWDPVIESGPEHTAGKRGSVDRRLEGIDHLKNQIDGMESETAAELAIIKHRYTIIAALIAAVIGLMVAGFPGALIFALVGAIVGYYYGSLQ